DFSARRKQAGGLLSSAHLDGFQSFGNAVERQVHTPGALFGDRIKLVAIDFGDSIRAADPQRSAPILHQFVNAVAGEPLRGGVVGESPISPAVQAAGSRAEPQTSVGVLMHCPNLLMLQRSRDDVSFKSAAVCRRLTPLSVPIQRSPLRSSSKDRVLK